jgi:hypothetical protein
MAENNSRNDGMSPGEILVASALIVFFALAAFVLLKWIVTTREGRAFGVVASIVLAVFLAVNATFGPPASSTTGGVAGPVGGRAIQHVPAIRVQSQAGEAQMQVHAAQPGWARPVIT